MAVATNEAKRPMKPKESHRHHFVPEFLLRSWATNGELNGYWWDGRKGRLTCRRKGSKAFCYEIDLLTLERHVEGRDVLERKFFGTIDTDGAVARDRLLAEGPDALNVDQRCDFARLLLSLEARRPSTVDRLRSEGARFLADALDEDPEILEAMESEGLSGTPSEWYEQHGGSLEDRALGTIQRLSDHSEVGKRLINCRWSLVRTGGRGETFVLSDRPLVRPHGYDHPQAAWYLPLDPWTRFCAVQRGAGLLDVPPHRIARKLNVVSAEQAERFVFCVDDAHERWLGKYLSRKPRGLPAGEDAGPD